jgi:hypothetical protein
MRADAPPHPVGAEILSSHLILLRRSRPA